MRSFLFLVFALTIAVLSAHTAGDYRTKQSGNWTTADTWEIYDGSSWVNAGSAPNSTNGVITIRNGHTVTINSTLTIDQTFVAVGGTLTVDLSSSERLTINNGSGDDLTVNGTLNLTHDISNGGNGLTGSGKTVINGICNWNRGHITNTDFNISSNGVMNMEGSGECRINWDGVINNAGTVNFAKTDDDFVMYYNGTFNNLEGGVFEATTNEQIYHRHDLSSYNRPVFNNAGTFRKTTGTDITTIDKMDFNNTGTVLVESGTFKFNNYTEGIHSGTFTIASGAKIFSDYHCTHTFQEGTVINGEGEYETTNGDANYVTGTTTGMIIDSDVTFKLSGNATLSGAGKLTINGTFDWTSTGNFNTGTIIVSQGANLNISGDNQKSYYYPSGANLMDNYGTITWSGAGNISGGGKTINNKNTGVFDIQNDASFIAEAGYGGYRLVNDGLVKKTASSGTTSFNVEFTNNGTLQVDTGTLQSSSLTNYSHNSGNPILGGGIYDLTGIFRFDATNGVYIYNNNATIILNGASSAILDHASGVNGMANLNQNTDSGSLTLLNGRNFSTGAADFTNNGTLDCGTNVFSGSGNFTNASGGTLIIGSPDGITSSGLNGNIQSEGTRTYSASGNYTFNGSSAQVTGNGLPATVHTLTIANNSGVTLSSNVTASTNLTLSEGALITGSNTLALGTSAEDVGTLTYTNGKIIGNFQRWLAASTVDDVLFPMGTASHYRPVNLSYTSAPSTGGTLTAGFTASDPGDDGLPLLDGVDYTINKVCPTGFWTLSSADGLSGGTYDLDVTAQGFEGVDDYTELRLLKRSNNANAWLLDGSHVAGTGSNENPTLHRSGLSGFSDFGVGSNVADNPLPVTLSSFTGTLINGYPTLFWITESETDNLGWNIFRSHIENGFAANNYLQLNNGIIAGMGTTTEPTNYSFTDDFPVNNGATYYYWLQSVSISGELELFGPVSIEIQDNLPQLPASSWLKNNFPNPFNPTTTIEFAVREGESGILSIYNISGQKVLSQQFEPGYHTFVWEAQQASGVYFYRLQTRTYFKTNKMILLR